MRAARTAEVAFILGILVFLACCSAPARTSGGSAPTDSTRTSFPATAPAGNQAQEPAGITFIELGSVNCVPCRAMQPVMEELRKLFPAEVDVVFHDVWTDEGAPYGRRYGIHAIPTQVFLDADGKEFFRHVGFYPLEDILKVLETKGVGR